MNVLQISSSGAKLCDEHGDTAGVALAFSLGQHLTLEFDLRTAESTDGVLTPLSATTFSECTSFYFALNNVWNAATAPLFLRTSGITISTQSNKTILSIELPDTGVASLIAALSGKANAVFTCEIGGLDEDALAVFVWQFQVTVHNRIYLGGDAPESVSGDPAYLTAAEVRAMIGEGTYFSSDSIEFTGGTSPTANLKIHNESPVYIAASGTAGAGLNVRVMEGLTLVQNYGEPYISTKRDSSTIILTDDDRLSVPTFRSNDTTSICSGTISLAVSAWTRYTGTCDRLAITSIENSTQESEILVTFAGTASAPDIGLPVGTQHAGTLPTYEAGKTYIINIRSGIVVAAEVKVAGGTAQ